MRNGSIDGVVMAIGEDEAWQGNLIDDERRQCLAWAERRLSEALEREKAYVRGILSTLNRLMECDPRDRADVIRAVLGE
jgi:hypothetical protein